jgi:uroporphyrinogen-III synthase
MASFPWRRGLQALVTRPREEAETLAAALAARGIGTLIEPMLDIQFRSAVASDLFGVQAVLCTSGNGVRALARASAERLVPLFAVGDATAARTRDEGFATVASAGGDVGDLVRLVSERLEPRAGKLLHACGTAVAGDLVGRLRAQGFTAERLELYEARAATALSGPAADALRCGDLDIALFFSPRTAAIFVGLASDAGLDRSCATVMALSISAAVDEAVAILTWRERLVAVRPSQAALLDALDARLASRPV